VGKGGAKLHEHWKDGLKTLHGLMTTKFPNWFFMGQGQNAIAPNYTSMIDDQAKHIAYIVGEVAARQGKVAEVTEEAETDWVKQIRASNNRPPEFYQACTPGYYNNEGQGGITLWAETYAPGPVAFNNLLKQWREAGELAGLSVK
jgi:cyclohexanone monooxygenase